MSELTSENCQSQPNWLSLATTPTQLIITQQTQKKTDMDSINDKNDSCCIQ